MTTPMEADIVGELRKQADGLERDEMPATAGVLRILADAIEIEQAHGKQCHDLLRRMLDDADACNLDLVRLLIAARELIGPTEKRT